MYRDDNEAYLKNAKAISLGVPIMTQSNTDKIEARAEGNRILLRAKLGKPKETKKIEASCHPESLPIINQVISPVAVNDEDEFEVKPKAKRPALS